ncbi:hypothetical protein GGTG_04114 [Gaeumannomyces tritici R3-111a-1]|uniref:RanBD1 domain-containing protein n=1 Tax=Gaeumannomyces tritici (strain R3-111a-1) TaxID=644352 RepID=J3NS68_GAET3|nr:hypothetical protein GGTG_04114 [Gaeumannomyces tritici R3-111a-1]EJT79024.1 hypothetical protein GGTG_04114 [Gaeumannomyces tritici R3-111a-1]
MEDDPHNTSEVFDAVGAESPKEDAATKATREELKHTVISDAPADIAISTAMDEDKSDRAPSAGHKTPDLKPPSTADKLKEQVSSPKKKRAHDEVEEGQESSVSPALSGSSSPRDSNGASRGERLEPEKKRARDEPEEETKKPVEQASAAAAASSTENAADPEPKDASKASALATEKADGQHAISTSEKDGATTKPGSTATSTSAFAKSGFAKLSGAASPFGALGAGAVKSSGFGGSLSSSPSPFGALGTGPTPVNTVPKLTFATPAADKSGPAVAASPFAALNGGPSKTFGSAFGSGFGSGFGASKLTSFAKPGGDLKDVKPARPFGAPESDNEGSSDGGEDDEEPETGTEEPESEKEPEEPKQATAADDKKKTKLQKVVVDDGEAGETTVFVARAKVYYMDSDAKAWKERGAGILKVNVPEATVDADDNGAVIPESFDASMLQGDQDGEDAEAGTATTATGPKVVRLIMRQDHTHRVVVNTAVTGATDFVKREMLRAATFAFSAVEGPEAKRVTLQIKMSPPNAEQFHKVIELIQKELKSLG